jgi:hypothetical protein
MLIEALVTAIGLSAGVGGAVAVWQRRLRTSAPPPSPTLEAAPYRAPEQPTATRDERTGGYPAPPSFDD